MDVPTVEFIVLSYPIITLYDLLESEARTSGRPKVPSVLRLQIKQKPGVLENRKVSTLHFLLAQLFLFTSFPTKYLSDEPTRPPLLRAFLFAYEGEEEEKAFCLIKKSLYAHFHVYDRVV